MRIEFIEGNLSEKQRQEIWELLCACDSDFYPPLSSRNSTSQSLLKEQEDHAPGKPVAYFNEMIKQNFILAEEDDRVIGFMTFKSGYCCPALESFGVSLYITTICVEKGHRGQGVSRRMYEIIEGTASKRLGYDRISTRTWSLNESHIHLLNHRGYKEITRLKNDRGEGIDTVYYGKKL